jgi:hypothetical protein
MVFTLQSAFRFYKRISIGPIFVFCIMIMSLAQQTELKISFVYIFLIQNNNHGCMREEVYKQVEQ